MKMGQEEIMGFFQNNLVKNFGYDDDRVVEALRDSLEELKSKKLDIPKRDKSTANELPTKPFGLFVPPSVEQVIGRRTLETETDLVTGKKTSIKDWRPFIPADGGPAQLPLELLPPKQPDSARTSVADDDDKYDTLTTDGASSRASVAHSSRTSVMDTSDAGSHATTVSQQPSSVDAQELPAQTPSPKTVVEVETTLTPEQTSEYDNLNNGYYEKDLDVSLDNVVIPNDPGVRYNNGVAVIELNGYPNPQASSRSTTTSPTRAIKVNDTSSPSSYGNMNHSHSLHAFVKDQSSMHSYHSSSVRHKSEQQMVYDSYDEQVRFSVSKPGQSPGQSPVYHSGQSPVFSTGQSKIHNGYYRNNNAGGTRVNTSPYTSPSRTPTARSPTASMGSQSPDGTVNMHVSSSPDGRPVYKSSIYL